jgi:N-acetylmuramoyl-L-alanine amidase
MSGDKQRGFGSFLKEAAWATLIAIGVVSAYHAVTAPEKELNLAPEAEISAPAELEGRLLEPAVPVEFNDIAYIIDPGHGGARGEKVGTTIIGHGIPERDYVLDVGNDVAGMLRSMGYRATEQTRASIDPELRLGDRLARFERDERNIGVSLHVNGCGDFSVRGVRVYHNPAGEGVAGYIAERLRPIFGSARTIPHTGYRVLGGDNPAVLVELGFGGSNAEDAGILTQRKDNICSAIAGALAAYHAEIAGSRGLENGR